MPNRDRRRHVISSPGVPLIDVEVGTAYRGRTDLDEHFVRSDLRDRDVDQVETGTGTELP